MYLDLLIASNMTHLLPNYSSPPQQQQSKCTVGIEITVVTVLPSFLQVTVEILVTEVAEMTVVK